MRPLLRLLLTSLLLLLPATIAPAFAEEATVAAPASQVLSYEGDAQLAELAAKGTTVVFFYAAWCPNCRATVTELNARWDEVNPGLT
ncbi:MAG: redoxin domain-containing protein, partial [Devosia sp.]|nr:redoxin domain-containing protein [Devosia sp.]